MKGNLEQTVEQQENPGNAQTNLKQYLECEALLGSFFERINYCQTQCVNQETGKYFIACFHPQGGMFIRGNIGCCLHDFYDEHSKKISEEDLRPLTEKRIEKYGLPVNQEEEVFHFGKPCRYHTNNGCLLKDHKSPICVAYICESNRKYLRDKFNIDYSALEVFDILEEILMGKTSEQQLIQFKSQINDWITKIQTKTN